MKFRSILIAGLAMTFSIARGIEPSSLPADNESIIRATELLEQDRCREALSILTVMSPSDNNLKDYCYLRGVAEDMSGNPDTASVFLEDCVAAYDRSGEKDTRYLDALIRLISHYQSTGDMRLLAETARKGILVEAEIRQDFDLSYAFYECFAMALNSLSKPSQVEKIVEEGLPFVEKSLKPTDKSFYNLQMAGIKAAAMMSQWEKADSLLSVLNEIDAGPGNYIMEFEIAALSAAIRQHHKIIDWHNDSQARLDDAWRRVENLLLNDITSKQGRETWTQFLQSYMRDLELFYFDISDPDDESYWTKLLSMIIVNFFVNCQDMEGREEIAYDISLLRKNFMDYHSPRLHKTPRHWRDIRAVLADNELAVEISTIPNEILIIGKDYEVPVALEIPEEWLPTIFEYTTDDVITVNDLYSDNSGFLSKIADMVMPYTEGIETIYISPTDFFCQFNFGAAPVRGERWDDFCNIVQMFTTADIEQYKRGRDNALIPASVLLIGGVDYDRADTEKVGGASSTLPVASCLRKGFGYLPFSLREVEDISDMLGDEECVVITGSNATEDALTESINAGCRILHLATHGYSIPLSVNDTDRNQSKISKVLSRTRMILAGANKSLSGGTTGGSDGILTSQEILGIDMSDIQLAVLSFCSSGLGDLTKTESELGRFRKV